MNRHMAYEHDVFISYSHADQEWVRGELLPSLEKEGLKAIVDYRDFEVGVWSLANIERAVDSSRHTLIVLTPEWIESEWTEFESLLAGTADPAGRRRKLIPLLLRACDPPLRIAMLTYADFTKPSLRETQMDRVLKAITADPKTDAPSDTAGDALLNTFTKLEQLVRDPSIHRRIDDFKSRASGCCDDMERLRSDKNLHDQLHEVKTKCYQRLLDALQKVGASQHGDMFDDMEAYYDNLQAIVGRLENMERRTVLAHHHEISWVQELQDARQELHRAVLRKDIRGIRRAIVPVERVLAIQPSRVSTRIKVHAKRLSLPAIVDSLEDLLDRLDRAGSDREPVEEFIDKLGGFVEILQRLRGTLASLVETHDDWQEMEDILRLISVGVATTTSATSQDTIRELDDHLARLRNIEDRARDHSTEPFPEPPVGVWAEWKNAIHDRDLAGVRRQHKRYERYVDLNFHNADWILKSRCEEVHDAVFRLAASLPS